MTKYQEILDHILTSIDAPPDIHPEIEHIYRVGYVTGLQVTLDKYRNALHKNIVDDLKADITVLIETKSRPDELNTVRKGDMLLISDKKSPENLEKALLNDICLLIEFKEPVELNLHTTITIVLEKQLVANDDMTYLFNRWPEGYAIDDFYALLGKYKNPIKLASFKYDKDYKLNNRQVWRASRDGWIQQAVMSS